MTIVINACDFDGENTNISFKINFIVDLINAISDNIENGIYLALAEFSWMLFLKRLISSTDKAAGSGLTVNDAGKESSCGMPRIEPNDLLTSPCRESF